MQFDNEVKPASEIKINNILYKKDLLTSKKVKYSMTVCDKADKMPGRWTAIPSRESTNTSSHFILQRPG